MPRYPYLNDDTPFDAASLNDRFDVLAGALNTLQVDAFAEQALNTVHVPSVVGDIATSETPEVRVDTPSHPGSPLLVGSGPSFTLEAPYPPEGEGYTVTLAEAVTLTRTTDATQPTALLVMANVEVKEFTGIEVIFGSNENKNISGITLNEYTWDATIVLVFESSTGVQRTLRRTERQVSPRVTIGTAGNKDTPTTAEVDALGVLRGRIPMSPLRDLPGNAELDVAPDGKSGPGPVYQQFDHKTYQDVAIRTVVTAADLTTLGLSDIEKVHLGFLSANSRGYLVQRANITAVPMLVEVV